MALIAVGISGAVVLGHRVTRVPLWVFAVGTAAGLVGAGAMAYLAVDYGSGPVEILGRSILPLQLLVEGDVDFQWAAQLVLYQFSVIAFIGWIVVLAMQSLRQPASGAVGGAHSEPSFPAGHPAASWQGATAGAAVVHSAPAGWLPGLEDPRQWRYWDGQRWTEHRHRPGT